MASCTMRADRLRGLSTLLVGVASVAPPRGSHRSAVDEARERGRTPPPSLPRHYSVDVAQRELVSNKQ